jgi:hypothetical protein
VVVAEAREIAPLVILIPPLGAMLTPPNCVVEAALRLSVTTPLVPPPVRPPPATTPEIVPVPGGNAEIVPSGATVKLAPTLTPPREVLVAGARLIVPETVIGAPIRPVPGVTKVTVPPAPEATFRKPNWSTEIPFPAIRYPWGVEIW